MDYNKLIERLHQHDKDYGEGRTQDFFRVCLDCKDAATALSTLQAENERLRKELEYEREHANAYHEECGQWEAENEKLREKIEDARLEGYAKGLGEMSEENERLWTELEQVKRENDALWIYIEIVDREYQRYMDRGYIDRLDELKRTWRRGQKED